jgi:hypothetical protein
MTWHYHVTEFLMTVAYSAYSKDKMKFVMGADNLEGRVGGIVSKIRVVVDRFAICVTGCDNPIHAFDGMRKMIPDDKDFEEGWFNITEVMNDLILWTKQYTEKQVEELGNTLEVKRCLNKPEDCESTIIVFDSKTFEMFKLEMTNIYPPKVFDPLSVKQTPLNEECLHLHAMAINRTNQLSEMPLPSNFFSDPCKELKALIKKDKDFHDRARSTQPDVPYIGELGSYCYFDSGKVLYVNLCSSSPS